MALTDLIKNNMRIHNLSSTPRKKSSRAGRGISAGQGKTAGRGTKGQKSRSGFNLPRTFEGGSTGMIQRLPKLKGFTSRRNRPVTINIVKLAEFFESGATISISSLVEKGLVSSNQVTKNGVKIVDSSVKQEKSFTYDLSDSTMKVSKTLNPS